MGNAAKKVLPGALAGIALALLLVGSFSGGVGSMMSVGLPGASFMLLFWGLVIALIVGLSKR